MKELLTKVLKKVLTLPRKILLDIRKYAGLLPPWVFSSLSAVGQ
jgi:hypothetical protein